MHIPVTWMVITLLVRQRFSRFFIFGVFIYLCNMGQIGQCAIQVYSSPKKICNSIQFYYS